MIIEENLLYQLQVVPNASKVFLLAPLFCIEEFLNSRTSEHVRARLQNIAGGANLQFHRTTSFEDIPVEVGLLLIAVNTASLSLASCLESTDTDPSIISQLSAVLEDSYQFEILDHGLTDNRNIVYTLTSADSPVRECYLSKTLNFSYTPPKGGDSGLFSSDEQLDEPEMRTFVCAYWRKTAPPAYGTSQTYLPQSGTGYLEAGVSMKIRYNLIENQLMRLGEVL